jgi:hypothetical protein
MGIIVVTTTYDRPGRIGMIGHLRSALNNRDDVRWVVVEDGSEPDPRLAEFLPSYATYLHLGPTRDMGNLQRNLALKHIRDEGLDGVVYNADDDNMYHPRLFDEIAKTKRVSMFPVGNLGPNGVERPIILNGKFSRWDSGWPERMFPVDMAGFAFHSDLLRGLDDPLWNHTGRGGESEFISRLVSSPHEVEFLCERCTDVLVLWNELRNRNPLKFWYRPRPRP